MEALSSLLFIFAIVGVVIYFVNKSNKEKELEAQRIAENNARLAEEEKQKEKELEQLQLKWEEIKNDYKINGLPVIVPATLKLTKNEVCYFEGNASFCKNKTQTVGYEGGSRGVSFRVMKGISFRVGNYQGHYVKEQITEKTDGTIYLTSKKVVYTAPTNSRVIKYDDIVNLSVVQDMLQIQTDERAYLYQIDDLFNFMSILDFILNKDKGND